MFMLIAMFIHGEPGMSILMQAAIFLIAAVIFVPLFRWLKLSSILGYVAAGLAIGPWGLGLITDVESILHASEFGVVLLLFVIGLELQPSRLWVLRHAVFGIGSVQMLLCATLIGGAAWWWGVKPLGAGVIGFSLALSSTALVLQVLAERGQLKSNHGRAAFGILLFQDLAVLPMLAVLPLAAHGTGGSLVASLLALGKLIAVMVAVVIGGRVLLRPALRLVARTKVTEVFTAATLLIVIGVSLIVSAVGLSMSLGAYLAGLEADIEPFKGLLLGLFFIAVGMSANLGLLTGQPMLLLAMTLGFMLLKFAAITLIGKRSRQPRDSAWRLGLSLVTGGEFAFVLFGLAAQQNILEPELSDMLVLSVTLSMMLGPLLLSAYDATLHRRFTRHEVRPFDVIDARDGGVLIAGFGRFGQIIGRVLRARHLSFTALDASPANIDFIRRFGSNVYYGDASRLDVLRAAGAEQATVLVLAIDDVEASLRTATVVRQHFPHLKIFARARNRQHAFQLMELGVSDIIRETYASSLEMAAGVLETLGASAAAARGLVKQFREHDEATLRKQFEVRDDDSKLVASAVESARQLEKLFEADAGTESSLPTGSIASESSQG
jgi:glutathione-regulated potassium-efflux system ancillary protein KefC/glutathione-regulated potassium-efflux system protein KefB